MTPFYVPVVLLVFGITLYSIATDKPKGRNSAKYVAAKIGGGITAVSASMIALRFTGVSSFWGLTVGLLIGQIVFKVLEDRCDRLAKIYC